MLLPLRHHQTRSMPSPTSMQRHARLFCCPRHSAHRISGALLGWRGDSCEWPGRFSFGLHASSAQTASACAGPKEQCPTQPLAHSPCMCSSLPHSFFAHAAASLTELAWTARGGPGASGGGSTLCCCSSNKLSGCASGVVQENARCSAQRGALRQPTSGLLSWCDASSANDATSPQTLPEAA